MLETEFYNGFTDERDAFLSNFYEYPIVCDDGTFPSGEAMFQAQKTLDQREQEWIIAAGTPGEAKRRGRQVELRADWDERIRYDAMRRVVAAKFGDLDLGERLVATGKALLVERNWWHDQTWGCCDCPRHQATPGRNLLGRYLMEQRAQLAPVFDDTEWTRVACTGHRPQGLPPGAQSWLADELRRIAAKLATEHGMRTAISGAAAGADLIWAEAAHAVDVSVWLYQPYVDHDERWPQDWRDRLAQAREFATRVDTLGEEFSISVLHARSDWMIRDADAVVAVVDPQRRSGGTWQALQKIPAAMPLIHVDVRNRHTTRRVAA
jgi:ribA/ribD-fused uncharacterized protein